MSDPSFAGQLITFTYPHIGNYGASARAMESERPWARAAIMRAATNREDAPEAERGWLDWLEDCGVPGDHAAWIRASSCATSARRARCAAGSSQRIFRRPRRRR